MQPFLCVTAAAMVAIYAKSPPRRIQHLRVILGDPDDRVTQLPQRPWLPGLLGGTVIEHIATVHGDKDWPRLLRLASGHVRRQCPTVTMDGPPGAAVTLAHGSIGFPHLYHNGILYTPMDEGWGGRAELKIKGLLPTDTTEVHIHLGAMKEEAIGTVNVQVGQWDGDLYLLIEEMIKLVHQLHVEGIQEISVTVDRNVPWPVAWGLGVALRSYGRVGVTGITT